MYLPRHSGKFEMAKYEVKMLNLRGFIPTWIISSKSSELKDKLLKFIKDNELNVNLIEVGDKQHEATSQYNS
jgi:hypothetical protein